MPQVIVQLTPEKLQELVFQLPARDFLALAARMQERAETMLMMRLAETGFRQWEHEEEDIYQAGPKTV